MQPSESSHCAIFILPAALIVARVSKSGEANHGDGQPRMVVCLAETWGWRRDKAGAIHSASGPLASQIQL